MIKVEITFTDGTTRIVKWPLTAKIVDVANAMPFFKSAVILGVER